ncbi:MAG: hypothetical protein WCG23_03500 [bacterium]
MANDGHNDEFVLDIGEKAGRVAASLKHSKKAHSSCLLTGCNLPSIDEFPGMIGDKVKRGLAILRENL